MKKFRLISTGQQIQLTGNTNSVMFGKEAKVYHEAFVPVCRSDPGTPQNHIQWIGQSKFEEIKDKHV